MTADSIISLTLPALKPTNTVEVALEIMNAEKLFWLPVVDNEHYMGMVSEDVLLDIDPDQLISAVTLDKQDVHIAADQHYFEALKILNIHHNSFIAVLDDKEKYIGSITKTEIINYINSLGFTTSPGGILVLSILHSNYSLSEISRIIESNNMKAICLYVSPIMVDSNEIAVTIKLDKTDLTRLIASFERFGYNILADFHETSFAHHDSERLDLLLKYLNI